MKKLSLTLFALISAATCALAFTACGGDATDEKTKTPDTEQGDTNNNKKPDAEQTVYTATEAEWDSAVTHMGVLGIDSNVTVTLYANEVKEKYYTYEIANGITKYYFEEGSGEEGTWYFEFDKSDYNTATDEYGVKIYAYEDDGWHYQSINCDVELSGGFLSLFMMPYFVYDNFEYNQATQRYENKTDVVFEKYESLFSYKDISIKFIDGKLIEMQTTATANEWQTENVFLFEFSKYGETAVTLPIGATDGSGCK